MTKVFLIVSGIGFVLIVILLIIRQHLLKIKKII